MYKIKDKILTDELPSTLFWPEIKGLQWSFQANEQDISEIDIKDTTYTMCSLNCAN